jgi:hypothetical protein
MTMHSCLMDTLVYADTLGTSVVGSNLGGWRSHRDGQATTPLTGEPSGSESERAVLMVPYQGSCIKMISAGEDWRMAWIRSLFRRTLTDTMLNGRGAEAIRTRS